MTTSPTSLIGRVVSPSGAVYPNATLTFRRYNHTVSALVGVTIVPEPTAVQTDASGDISASMMPGSYIVSVETADGRHRFTVSVPETDDPVAIDTLVSGDIIPDMNAVTGSNANAERAETAAVISTTKAGEASTSADLSEAWAAGTEPGGPDTKSALEWAGEAQGHAESYDAVALATAVATATTKAEETATDRAAVAALAADASIDAAAAAASLAALQDSETNAAASETAAGISETNAAASAAAALVSENNAATSETNAGLSETAAAASETAAGVSETNAAASAATAEGWATDANVVVVADNIATINAAADVIPDLQIAFLQMATAFADSQARYIAAHAFP